MVEGERIKRKVNIQPGIVNLSPRQIKGFPALAEPDIFRAIQALPGVLTSSEFSTGLIIRGGNTDQNLILLDGITVYNPSHLGGVFSNFIVPKFSKGYSVSILLFEVEDSSPEPMEIKYLATRELSLASLMFICLEE